MTYAAVIQMVSTVELDANLHAVSIAIQKAVRFGAAMVFLPENFALMAYHENDKLKIAIFENSSGVNFS